MILRCDYRGFKEPEMVKPRPVVVISVRPQKHYSATCIVVPLSTTPPDPVQRHHLLLKLPGEIPAHLSRTCWIKGDMISTVALSRLDLYQLERNSAGKRVYYMERLDHGRLFQVRQAVGHAIGLHVGNPR